MVIHLFIKQQQQLAWSLDWSLDCGLYGPPWTLQRCTKAPNRGEDQSVFGSVNLSCSAFSPTGFYYSSSSTWHQIDHPPRLSHLVHLFCPTWLHRTSHHTPNLLRVLRALGWCEASWCSEELSVPAHSRHLQSSTSVSFTEDDEDEEATESHPVNHKPEVLSIFLHMWIVFLPPGPVCHV